MDRRTKVLFGILIVALVCSVFITFHQTVILKNFDIIETEEGE